MTETLTATRTPSTNRHRRGYQLEWGVVASGPGAWGWAAAPGVGLSVAMNAALARAIYLTRERE
jgi:hypothetical protein